MSASTPLRDSHANRSANCDVLFCRNAQARRPRTCRWGAQNPTVLGLHLRCSSSLPIGLLVFIAQSFSSLSLSITFAAREQRGGRSASSAAWATSPLENDWCYLVYITRVLQPERPDPRSLCQSTISVRTRAYTAAWKL